LRPGEAVCGAPGENIISPGIDEKDALAGAEVDDGIEPDLVVIIESGLVEARPSTLLPSKPALGPAVGVGDVLVPAVAVGIILANQLDILPPIPGCCISADGRPYDSVLFWLLGPGVAEVVITSGISVNWLKLDWSSASLCRIVALSGTVDEEGMACPSAEFEESLRLYDVGPGSDASSTLLELLRRPLPKSDRADERDDRLDGGDRDNCEVWEEGPDGRRLSDGRENSEDVVVRLARSSRDALVDLDCDRETSY